jgi:hypothetical protein
MESGSRGVLDRPIESGDDESLWSSAVPYGRSCFAGQPGDDG